LRIRAALQLALIEAIAAAHPDDARDIMTAALVDLSAGYPEKDPFSHIREDARFWASLANPAELLAYATEAMQALPDRPLILAMRKRLFMILWRSFDNQVQSDFLAWAKGGLQ
jgi:hypothetical protein